MRELIYKDDAVKRLREMVHNPNKDPILLHYERILRQGSEEIQAMPEAVVRCKDCKHWMPYDWMFSEVWRSVNMDDYSEDEIGCAYCDMNMHANDFCSRAERQEEGEEQ